MAFDNFWAFNLPSDINTIVKTKSLARLASKYTSVSWTMDESERTTPIFPSVFVMIDCIELGNDLIGTDINAVNCEVEVQVTVTKEQGLSGARYVAGVVADEFKALGFEIREMPYFKDNTTDLKRMIFRGRRIIGQADIINS